MKEHQDSSHQTTWLYKDAAAIDMGSQDTCLSKIPYATLIATLLLCSGVGIFLGATYRGVTITVHTIEVVFNFYFSSLGDLRIVFCVFGIIMAVISISMLIVGFLATGSTRSKVYKGWKARLGGRISCGVLTCIAYITNLIWLGFMAFLVVIVFIFFLMSEVCNNIKKLPNMDERCIDFTQFENIFPKDTVLRICQEGKLKTICKDCVETGIVMFILALAASILVIISLIHYLMCLAANTARIKDHEKLQDLQELQCLHENVMSSKSRYHDISPGIFREESFQRGKSS